jgi:peptidoglycan/xylan/chitin deacetylase (PgdA/CDA1 family)
MKQVWLTLALFLVLSACNNISQDSVILADQDQHYAFAEDIRTLKHKLTGYLTIDDFTMSSTEAQLDKILAVLNKYNAKATFFLNCKRFVDEPETLSILRKIQTSGNSIGNHSYSHFSEGTDGVNNKELRFYYPDMPTQAYRWYTWWYGYALGFNMLYEEVVGCDKVMKDNNITAYKKIFRPPYGEMGTPLIEILSKAGYSGLFKFWSNDTCDYKTSTTAQEIRDAILLGTIPKPCTDNESIILQPIRNNDVVLLHFSDRTNTVQGLDLALQVAAKYFNFKGM